MQGARIVNGDRTGLAGQVFHLAHVDAVSVFIGQPAKQVIVDHIGPIGIDLWPAQLIAAEQDK